MKAVKAEFILAIKTAVKKMNDKQFFDFMKRVLKVVEDMQNE